MPRVLLFDDDPNIVDIVTRMLMAAGYVVVAGQKGSGAVRRQVGRDNYDVLLTDIFMPDIDGIEIIRAARQARPDVPIVCMSGGTLHLSAEFGLNLSGAFGVERLAKPFGLTELLSAMQAALGRAGTPLDTKKSSGASR